MSSFQTVLTSLPQIGSLGVFWGLIEPVLTALKPMRLCEIGVAEGVLTARLLDWGQGCGCSYVGIDPTPGPEVTAWFSPGGTRSRTLLVDRSLTVLPTLERCDAYFLDGDHNYYTVRHELGWIARTSRSGQKSASAPVIFMHDVSWPWGRRDMYYLPSEVPADQRGASSESMGVVLGQDALVEGGLREPGRYAIALSPGGPRNGVLTAVEDFLARPDGKDWAAIFLPMAYGLAILYQPAHPSLSAGGRERLDALRSMAAMSAGFFEACEQSYLKLYLYGEHTQNMARILARDHQHECAAHQATLTAYNDLQRAHRDLLAKNRR